MAQNSKSFYGYLFEPDKKPTPVLDALLRGIALYISEHLENTKDKYLTPEKLAAFYKAVGGNYDSFFVNVPPPSISWIYASIGCQHLLLPTSDSFIPPSIPALTPAGFVRWQSIEILLGPEEHVPFIQASLRLFNIKHPDTKEPFPIDLPSDAFPLVADPDIEKWHQQCAQKLRSRATPPDTEDDRLDPPSRPKVQTGYSFSHVRARPEARTQADYLEWESQSRSRPLIYQHVSSARPVRPGLSTSPAHRANQFLSPETIETRGRRKSYPDEAIQPDISIDEVLVEEDPPRKPKMKYREPGRRHSHPKQARRLSFSSESTNSNSESDVAPGLRRSKVKASRYAKSRAYSPRLVSEGRYSTSSSRERGRRPFDENLPPVPAVRYAVPTSESRSRYRERENMEDERKNRSLQIPHGVVGSLTSSLTGGKKERGRERASGAAEKRDIHSSSLRWRDVEGSTIGLREDEEERRERIERRSRDRRKDRDRDRDRDRDKERDINFEESARRDRHSDREHSFRKQDRRYASPTRSAERRRYHIH